jgi:hypothetical protein
MSPDCLDNHDEVLEAVNKRITKCKQEVSEDLETLKDRLDSMHQDISHMRDLLDAWNSAKGFVITMKFLATSLRWIAVIGGTVGVIWYFIKFGTLPPPSGPTGVH